MVDFLHNNSIYVVLGIALILWFGIGSYLFWIDKRITKLEDEVNLKISDEKRD
jgi:CcmD family protein